MILKSPLAVGAPVLLLLATLSAPQGPTRQDPGQAGDALDLKIRKLMELTGAGDLGMQAMHQMIEAFEKMPQLPEGFLAKLKATVRPDDLIDLIVPVYKKHLDEATIDAAIEFARTPAGKKLYAAQPQILKETMQAGQAWGEAAAKKVLEELRR